MAVALLLARLLLSVLFLVAGLAKLADLPGSQKALHNFGLPGVLAAPLGIVLPIVEILTAIALVPVRWTWYGGSSALVLLLIFSAGISYNLARGRRPDCHCFGQLHSAPVGPSTLLRNILLALLAGLVAWSAHVGSGLSATRWFTSWPLAQQIALSGALLVVFVLAGVGWLLLHGLRQQGRLLLRIERLESRLAQTGIVFGISEQAQAPAGLPVGTKAPAFSGRGLDHESISLAALRALAKPVVLIFTSPTCVPCAELMPEVGRWQRDYAETLTIALISRGSVEDNCAKAAEHHLVRLVLQNQNEIDTLYDVHGTPCALLIHPDGLIDSNLAMGPEAIQSLVEKAAGMHQVPLLPLLWPVRQQRKATTGPAVPRIGMPAPAFSLPDLQGKPVSLSNYLGTPTLLLFWNPDCGFCQKMLPDVQAWEANPPQGAPRLLLISRGSVEKNRALDLRSSVLLSETHEVRKLFGAEGTPMALFVDAQGRIASTLVEGAPDVLALAGSVRIAPRAPLAIQR